MTWIFFFICHVTSNVLTMLSWLRPGVWFHLQGWQNQFVFRSLGFFLWCIGKFNRVFHVTWLSYFFKIKSSLTLTWFLSFDQTFKILDLVVIAYNDFDEIWNFQFSTENHVTLVGRCRLLEKVHKWKFFLILSLAKIFFAHLINMMLKLVNNFNN
jgi:hypothetical protein